MHDGLTEEKIAQIDAYQDSDAFTAQEKLALHFAEKMALSHHEIDDEFFRELRAEFSDAEALELGMMIGQYIGLGRLLMVLDLERPVCSIE